MRIILLAAAVIGSAAIGTAAAARPGSAGSGHGPPGTWSSGGGHHSGRRGDAGFATGGPKGDRRHHRFGRFGRDDFNSYGAAGIAGQAGIADPYGNGFFTGGGGRIKLRGGRPYFDYDRSYPYEWAPALGLPEREDEEEPRSAERPGRCTFENGVRVCRGG
jgi:hypothetical protein